MKTTDLARYKQQLLDLKAELEDLETASIESGGTVVLDQSAVGRLSRMDALQLQQMALESERRRKLQLVRIHAALKRIEDDDFGFCTQCDDEIKLGRLQFDPTSTRCIRCAE